MRKRDYKNHFDNIKCRPEFKEKMEKILSSKSDGEYADSVKDIEYAPKINYHRWTVLVASCILVAGLGGAVFYNIKNSVSEPIYSNIESSKNTTDITESVELNCEVNFKIRTVTGESESSAFGKMSDSRFYEKDFGRLPDFIVNEISEQLQNCDWIEVSEDSMNFNSASVWVDDSEIDYSAPAVILSYTGEENFVCTVSESGYVMIEDDNGKRYCENSLYYDIIETIAYNLPYCDWTSMVDGETGIALDTAFKNHADEIRLNGIINGLIYPSAMEKVLGLKFFDCGEFEAYIQKNGDLNICYKRIDDVNCEDNRVYFSSSAELYDEIARAVNAEEERFENTNEELFSLINTDIESGQQLLYNYGNGMSFIFEDDDINIIYDAIKSLEWSEGESGIPKGEFFSVGGNFITRDGIIYTFFNDKSFIAENQDISALTNAFDDLKILFEYRGKNTNDRVSDLVDINIKDSLYITYMSNAAGQDSTSVLFENINTENLCTAIKSLEWTEIGSDYPRYENFIIGDLMITTDGKIYNSSEHILYSAENQDYSTINNAIDEIIKADDVGYMMYLIASSENKFSTMSGQIICFYKEYDIFGEGEFYYDNKKHDEYINVKDISGSASFAMQEGEWTFDRNYNEGTNFSEKGFRFYDTPLIEYKWLKNTILSYMKMTDTSELISFDVTEIEESYNFCLNYINDDKQNIVVSVNIDSIGNPTEVVISEYFTDDEGNNLSNTEILFSIGNGIGGGIVYDDPNFIIPQSSVNYSSKE